MTISNRWLVAGAGTALQLCLGTVYAWSYFQKPLMEGYHWSNAQVSWVFSLAICFLGLAAALGGMSLERFGPRRLAVLGGILFGSGNLLAALALHLRSLPLLYAGFGIIGGSGLGLCYVTPVATAAKWFPDKKGLITGMVVMGFGLGAFLMSKILAPLLMGLTGGNLVSVFLLLGAVFLAATTGCGSLLRPPPPGYSPEGYTPPARERAIVESALPTIEGCLGSGQFMRMWLVFFCNIVAGIAMIGFQSPLLQDLLKTAHPGMTVAALSSVGASLIAASSLFNGFGRLFWGGFSDRFGRVAAFRIMLATQVAAFLALSQAGNPWVFAGLVCYVLFCYGGGFGAMPSFVSDVFGEKRMPVVYGTILTAWSAGGIVGPQLVAWLKDHYPKTAGEFAFLAGAGFLTTGLLVSLRIADKGDRVRLKESVSASCTQTRFTLLLAIALHWGFPILF